MGLTGRAIAREDVVCTWNNTPTHFTKTMKRGRNHEDSEARLSRAILPDIFAIPLATYGMFTRVVCE